VIVSKADRAQFRDQLTRRRGRPRVYEGTVERVMIRIPAPLYDRLDRAARTRDLSVPDVIRHLLTARLEALEDRGPAGGFSAT